MEVEELRLLVLLRLRTYYRLEVSRDPGGVITRATHRRAKFADITAELHRRLEV